jgi:hypothetical protein
MHNFASRTEPVRNWTAPTIDGRALGISGATGLCARNSSCNPLGSGPAPREPAIETDLLGRDEQSAVGTGNWSDTALDMVVPQPHNKLALIAWMMISRVCRLIVKRKGMDVSVSS